jgi:metal-responsive CopG/Arc/MetJ family transcriptional regulator
MTTISVPLPPDLLEALDNYIALGGASTKAEAMRIALRKHLENEAVEAVLRAAKEPDLEGDLLDLAKKL